MPSSSGSIRTLEVRLISIQFSFIQVLLYERLFALYAQSIEKSIDTALKKQRKTRVARSASGAGLITRGGLHEHDNKRYSKLFQKDIHRKEICGNSSPP